jgi:hypothetical protein
MNPRLLALALVLALPVLAGCNPAAKLHGTWDLEIEEPNPAEGGSIGGIGGTYIPSAIQSFLQLKRNIEFKYDGNVIVELRAAGEKEIGKGKWKWVKSEKDVLVLKVTMEGSQEQEVRVKFVDRNKVEMPPFPVGKESWTDTPVTFTRRGF